MKKPRKIEFEFHGFKEDETYVYWKQYSEELEKYIQHLESKSN